MAQVAGTPKPRRYDRWKLTAVDSRTRDRAIAWIIVGHERHHLKVLRERYLV